MVYKKQRCFFLYAKKIDFSCFSRKEIGVLEKTNNILVLNLS